MNKKYTICVLLLLAITSVLCAQNVVINEVMAANNSILKDNFGDYPDWIELYNAGPVPIDLAGWGVTDDTSRQFKWTLPPVTLPADSFLILFASGRDTATWVAEWETVIDAGDSAHYLDVQRSMSYSWIFPAFDDQDWLLGPGGFGYGDGDDQTIVSNSTCLYYRKSFEVADKSEIRRLLLHIDYDDGFVAYLNGVQVARANLTAGGEHPPWDTQPDEPREAELYQGGQAELFVLDEYLDLLVNGTNLLAIEVHNYGTSSSDMSLIPYLTVGHSKTGISVRSVAAILDLPKAVLHTNFKISSKGEPLQLSDSDGQRVDLFPADSIPVDISRGHYPDGTAGLVYFESPTPGKPNSSNGYASFAPAVQASLPAGYYPDAQTITLSCPAQANIYYTTDGTIPTPGNALYQSPLVISGPTVVRARVFADGQLPGPVLTNTYIVQEENHLPVFSLSTNPSNLWDEQSGIYVKGPNAETAFPYFGANFWQDWEKAAHMELFDEAGTRVARADCGIKIYGAWSRGYPQKSLAVHFRNDYGQRLLEYPVFNDPEITSYKSLVLRNAGNDWEFARLRDMLSASVALGLNLDVQDFQPVIVYLNGAYWGIHNLREKINEHFLAAHHMLPLPDDPANSVDLLENENNIILGDNEHYLQLLDYLDSHDLNTVSAYKFIESRIDLDAFWNYICLEIFVDNTDWPGNNVKFWRPKTADGRWRWILYDTDFGYDIWNNAAYNHNTLAFALEENGPGWPNPPWSTFLLRKLLQNDDLRAQFISRFMTLLQLQLDSGHMLEHLDRMVSVLESDMERHSDRWGFASGQWQTELERIRTFLTNRPVQQQLHLMSQFNLTGSGLLKLAASDTSGGNVYVSNIRVDKLPWTGSYFTGVPLKISALAKPGYHFAGWTGDLNLEYAELEIEIQTVTSLQALFEQGSSDTSGLVLNEINYHSAPNADAGDWVEIYNNNDQLTDCSGWILMDEKDSHQFTFPTGTTIETDSFLVIAENLTRFKSIHPQVENVIGNMDFGLSGSGELVRLFNPGGSIIDSLTYDDKAPWPLEADGQGATLELIDPSTDNTNPANWQAGLNGGSPGRRNTDATALEQNTEKRDFKLYPNYPNPFNPETQIRFSIPRTANVRLEVFNLRGQLVRELLNQKMSGGIHRVTFRPQHLASGIYLYRLMVNQKQIKTNKMLLIH